MKLLFQFYLLGVVLGYALSILITKKMPWDWAEPHEKAYHKASWLWIHTMYRTYRDRRDEPIVFK